MYVAYGSATVASWTRQHFCHSKYHSLDLSYQWPIKWTILLPHHDWSALSMLQFPSWHHFLFFDHRSLQLLPYPSPCLPNSSPCPSHSSCLECSPAHCPSGPLRSPLRCHKCDISGCTLPWVSCYLIDLSPKVWLSPLFTQCLSSYSE